MAIIIAVAAIVVFLAVAVAFSFVLDTRIENGALKELWGDDWREKKLYDQFGGDAPESMIRSAREKKAQDIAKRVKEDKSY